MSLCHTYGTSSDMPSMENPIWLNTRIFLKSNLSPEIRRLYTTAWHNYFPVGEYNYFMVWSTLKSKLMLNLRTRQICPQSAEWVIFLKRDHLLKGSSKPESCWEGSVGYIQQSKPWFLKTSYRVTHKRGLKKASSKVPSGIPLFPNDGTAIDWKQQNMAEGSENAPAALVMGFCALSARSMQTKKCHQSELFWCVEKIILSR